MAGKGCAVGVVVGGGSLLVLVEVTALGATGLVVVDWGRDFGDS